MNAFEKAIQFLAPQTALTRQVARNKLEVLNALQNGGGYGLHGASIVKKSLSSWITGGKDADSDIVETLRRSASVLVTYTWVRLWRPVRLRR